MKYRGSLMLCLIASAPFAYGQSVPAGGPIAELQKRVANLEKELIELRGKGAKRSVVDVNGKFVGYVFTDTLNSATVDLPFRGGTKKFVITNQGGTDGPGYSAKFYVSADCSGVGYARASRYDGSLDSNFWGTNYLWRNLRTGKFEFPRVGAVPSLLTFQSLTTGSSGCILMSDAGASPADAQFSAYAETDLEVIDPLAGFVGPYRIIP